MVAGTRAERQAQTREALIDVARVLFLRDGFAATSLDRVAVEAGFSKGAVYSNFSGKEELGLAVLDDLHTEQLAAAAAAMEGKHTLDDTLDALAWWAREHLGQPKWTALEVEFASIARHNPFVAEQIAARHKAVRQAIEHLVRKGVADLGVEPAMPAEQIATIVLSLSIGLGAQRSLDPGIDVELFAATLRRLLAP
ncbi:TetR/AcrR family transcriptional regulator [Solicola gregarius]|uniref:TetR/AcrR family transcriptional regulator n=1 Tax=Solicola gregarius TaxID=2908642 RepID=A0AA46TKX9_9ACTN|nr:TetR/AcrR family transcriptional regulator [Solicola gregarius]UYM07023.1 TetR/AcrR family transcriptional regulator [Solicola gregarius]